MPYLQLHENYNNLKEKSNQRDKEQRGYELEKLVIKLIELERLYFRAPFKIPGEQIDGAFEFKGCNYLVEVKWQQKKISNNDLYTFQGKIERRFEGTRGLFVSISGFQKSSLYQYISAKRPNIILWDERHIEAILERRYTFTELLDVSIRSATDKGDIWVFPDTAIQAKHNNGFNMLIEACISQVDYEITSQVGSKFIEELYVVREIQGILEKAISSEICAVKMYNDISKLNVSEIASIRKRVQQHFLHNAKYEIIFRDLLDKLEIESNTTTLNGFFNNVRKLILGKLHVFIGKAGTGKTNIFCKLAKKYYKDIPTIFLTAKSGVSPEMSLVKLLQSKLSKYYLDKENVSLNINQIIDIVNSKNTLVIVFLDAINEHRDLECLNTAIIDLLYYITGLPVLIIASCRDVYWPFFDRSCWPENQFTIHDIGHGRYTHSEALLAIDAYFKHYKISARLIKDAEIKLSHPLLLRFFCEAYGDIQSSKLIKLPTFDDIRLKDLFDKYLRRKVDSIKYTAPKRRRIDYDCDQFLFNLANAMRHQKCRGIKRYIIGDITNMKDLDSPESLYISILAEDIILEEEPDNITHQINVTFTYDEFMEYMIAKAMIWSVDEITAEGFQKLIAECIASSIYFPSFIGIYEYLILISREQYNISVYAQVSEANTNFVSATIRAIQKLKPTLCTDYELITLVNAIDNKPYSSSSSEAFKVIIQIINDSKYNNFIRLKAVDILISKLNTISSLLDKYRYIESITNRSILKISESAKRLSHWWITEKSRIIAKKVLISEPEKNIRKLVKEHLTSELGLKNIYTEENAQNTIVIANQIIPDLIITDIKKGNDMNGIEMAAQIKSNTLLVNVPIIAHSALVSNKWRSDPELSGLFSMFVMKSCDLDNLSEAVLAMLICNTQIPVPLILAAK